ncbi:MAG: amidohydrolase family protein [Chromatiales bacterium]|nr:amidohydrolase family protein [Chromatiales bacterium]
MHEPLTHNDFAKYLEIEVIVDIHAHGLPQETIDALRDGAARFPGVQLIDNPDGRPQLAFAGHKPTRPVMPKLREAAPRQAFLTEQGIDKQLVGGWLDSFGYELEPDEGADWSRFLNEHHLRVCAGNDALVPLATVPLQSGEKAAEVLREAVAAGMPGAMIGTQPFGDHGNLDDPQLDPFWTCAAQLKVPIIVHPMFGSGDARLTDFEMMNAVGRVSDVTIAIARLLFSGHLIKHEDLRLVASTGGGALPYALGRLQRNHHAHPNAVADPVEGFSRLYFDSIVFTSDTLRFLLDKVGAGRIMLGSDYPFPIGDPQPRRVIEEGGFSVEECEQMLGGVATQLFCL